MSTGDVGVGLDPTVGVIVSAVLSALVAVAGIVFTQRQVRRQNAAEAAARTAQNAQAGSQASYDNLQQDLTELRNEHRADKTAWRVESEWQAAVMRILDDEVNELRKLLADHQVVLPARKNWPQRPPSTVTS